MGKPFKSELLNLKSTYEWATNLNLDSLKNTISSLNTPIYFVGSGGSLSACYFGVGLAEKQGQFSKAITPLELYSLRNTIRNASVIFISASGKNSDILFGFKTAIRFEAKFIVSICMQSGSKLAKLSNKYSISEIYEFLIPVGKDGFLATNSLIAYFTILNRVYSTPIDKLSFSNDLTLKEISAFTNILSPNTSITILYNGYSKPIAYDIESKSVEAALYPILLSDFRNFGHGRHHWFAKKNDTSAVIAIASPDDNFLAEKTLDALPSNIPKLLLKTTIENSIGSIDLLVQSFYLIDKFGESMGIDPGRPGVPLFGRKLYNLKYASTLTRLEDDFGLSLKAKTAISRKINKPISAANMMEVQLWSESYSEFLKALGKANFGAIVFDYDGTICSSKRKYDGLDELMAHKLKGIVENGFYIGIATGRGKSVRRDLQKVIPKKYWPQVMIGYYNGSEVGILNDNSLPNLKLKVNAALKNVYQILSNNKELEIECTLRPNQLTIEFNKNQNLLDTKETIVQVIKSFGQSGIEVLESSHSIDIIDSEVSKTDLLNPLKEILETKNLSTDLLCLGDRGKWPGNDFKLLDTPYSLSVYEVSNSRDTCWNIAPLGISHTDATLHYLDWLKFEPSRMKLKVSK